MSFFKKMLAKVGIGGIEIDTQFETEEFIPGQLVEGVIVAKGGKVEQKVNKIYFELKTEYIKPVESDSDRDGEAEIQYHKETFVIETFVLGEKMVFSPGETIEIPFSFELPHETPVSIGQSAIWIQTGLDIDNAVDPTDRDELEVLLHPYTTVVYEALEELGFELIEAENEYYPQKNFRLPFIQKFEFSPTVRSEYKGSIDELEVIFYPDEDGVEIVMEFDRKARGFTGLLADMLDLDESLERFSFSSDELEEGTSSVAEQLSQIFDKLLE